MLLSVKTSRFGAHHSNGTQASATKALLDVRWVSHLRHVLRVSHFVPSFPTLFLFASTISLVFPNSHTEAIFWIASLSSSLSEVFLSPRVHLSFIPLSVNWLKISWASNPQGPWLTRRWQMRIVFDVCASCSVPFWGAQPLTSLHDLHYLSRTLKQQKCLGDEVAGIRGPNEWKEEGEIDRKVFIVIFDFRTEWSS